MCDTHTDSRRKNIRVSARNQRRTLLVSLLIAASPATAGNPFTHTRPLLPLAPSQTTGPAGKPQINPFCLTETQSSTALIKLASGDTDPRIRLHEIGEAIGLQPVQLGSEKKVAMPTKIVETKPVVTIQANPLIVGRANNAQTNNATTGNDSAFEDRDQTASNPISSDSGDADGWVATPSQDNVQRVEKTQTVPESSRQSSLVLKPVRRPVLGQAATASPSHPTVVQPNHAIVHQSTSVAPPAPVIQPQTTPDVALKVENKDTASDEERSTEPIVFSLTDGDSLATDAPASDAVATDAVASASEPQTVSLNDGSFGDTADVSLETANNDPDEQNAKADEATTPLMPFGVVEPIDLENLSNALPMGEATTEDSDAGYNPTHPQQNEFCVEPELVPVVNDLVPTPEPTLHSKRYRPPVAVHTIPVLIESSKQTPNLKIESVSEPNSEPVLAAKPNHPDPSAPQTTKRQQVASTPATPLYMHRAQVRSLMIGAELSGVKIGDKNVCQAFASGPNELKLIGTGTGVTRLVVWAKPASVDSPPRMRAFDVHVKDTVEVTGNSIGNKIELLNQTIASAFPEALVSVEKQQGNLVVSGTCSSQTMAKDIVRMVRKTCLVPVLDQLEIR